MRVRCSKAMTDDQNRILVMSTHGLGKGLGRARFSLFQGRRKPTMRTTKVIAAAAFALLLAAACSSTSPIGDIFGSNSRYDIRGTVDSVDTSSRSIWLTN